MLGVSVIALLAGGGLYLWHDVQLANLVWISSALLLAISLALELLLKLHRRQTGLDLLALIAIVGALLLHQNLVAAVIAVMLASGRALEEYTTHRAERELRGLAEHAARFAWRYRDGALQQIPVDEVVAGDRLLLRAGEVVPVDGIVQEHTATLDEAALTGESLPRRFAQGETISSGAVNAGAAFDLRAIRPAAQSTYAGIVRMVEAARNSRAPSMRLADRYALWFIPLSLGLSGAAWLISGDPVRALAVLVVATPCPLILAVPVAIVAGISRCAHRGILVKTGGTLEALAQAQILFLDKTGTLTTGQVTVLATESAGVHPADRLLQLAASLAQASPHVVAQAMVQFAQAQGVALEPPRDVGEEPGAGLCGTVGGYHVVLGSFEYVTAGTPSVWAEGLRNRLSYEDVSGSFIGIDGEVAGAVKFSDPLRLESPRALRLLRHAGIRRIVMLTGDLPQIAQSVGLLAGVDEVRAGLTPAMKLAAIAEGHAEGVTLMVGDGINDAPALAAADVGIALGARGARASSEAAGVVLLADRLDRIAEAMQIAQRTRKIAVQGVLGGMGLSFVAMVFAALGLLLPLPGALLQEAIDVAVIVSALRALGDGGKNLALNPLDAGESARVQRDHAALMPVLERLHAAAKGMTGDPSGHWREELRGLVELLVGRLLPHELADESRLYPKLAERLHGADPLASMSHTHREIFRLIHLLERMDEKGDHADPPSASEIQRVLQRLDTVVSLHFAQEDELYHNLDGR